MFSRSFTLTEILIAVVLMGLVILAVTTIDITSRRFFKGSSRQSQIFDEAKIAMEHMVKNIQSGVGDMSNSRDMGDDPYDATGCSRGFYILDGSGNLTDSGSRIQVRQDRDEDGSIDTTVEYEYRSADRTIRFYPDATDQSNYELLAEAVETVTFSFDNDTPVPNRVNVSITVLRDPSEDEGPENPETTLTSSIVLRAMSCN